MRHPGLRALRVLFFDFCCSISPIANVCFFTFSPLTWVFKKTKQLGGFSVRNSLHVSSCLIVEIGPLVRHVCGLSMRVCDRLDYCTPTHASRHHLLVQIRDRLREDTYRVVFVCPLDLATSQLKDNASER
jgi:hypothetical protein